MKKKNLIILLMIPFIIALLGIVTINTTFNLIENDILGIDWNYSDMEGFKMSNGRYQLEATPIIQSKYPASLGNNLVWSVENKNEEEETHAEIIHEGNIFYLKTISIGEVIITCSNEKGNIFRQMTGVIYDNGVILVNAKALSSQNNIDNKLYYGEYNLVDNKKEKATIEYDIQTVPASLAEQVKIKDITDNIEFNLEEGIVSIISGGDSHITLGVDNEMIAKDVTISFGVVEDGVNVYNYDELLYCTNESVNGEAIVLRKSFESLENAYVMNGGNVVLKNGEPVKKSDSIELFGHYNVKTKKYSFEDEIYSFETTFNQDYITEWNKFADRNFKYDRIENYINVGLRVQKSIYGNGFTINLHNLTYPYGEMEVKDDNGNIQYVPNLTNDNLFRGPRPFYTLGDPNKLPLVTAYGQDNIGVYLDGDDIVMNDVYIKNCDYGNNLTNLDTVGTVVEVNGDNVTISNSRLANGKHVLRSYSSMNLTLKNSMFSDARNFLVEFGTNELIRPDDNKKSTYITSAGGQVEDTIVNYFKNGYENSAYADMIVNEYLGGGFSDKTLMKNSLLSMQDALNDPSVEGEFKGSANIIDCVFYRSGISSIVLENLFNGPYLYSNIPSTIGGIFSRLESEDDRPIIPLEPNKVSGQSYPVKVNISGNTRFYDYKKVSQFDLTGLIDENISKVANMVVNQEVDINIDDIFPLKPILLNQARSSVISREVNGETSSYINVPVAYYGGGANYSVVTYEGYNLVQYLSDDIIVDLVDNYLDLPPGSGMMGTVKNMMVKTVTTVAGFDPFKFVCTTNDGYLFGETPSVSDLKANAKGA